MLSQDLAARPTSAPNAAASGIDHALPVELLELELSLEAFDGDEAGFCEAVRRAATAAEGEFLFDLPAAGLIADCRRIAVIRIPCEPEGMRVVLARLNEDGAGIRLQEPDEETEHLVRFADAFIDVLRRMPDEPAAS